MNKWKKWIPALFLGMLLLLAACGGDSSGEGESTSGDGSGEGSEENADSGEKGEINIGLNNWAENVAVSNMWKVILENKGYTVNLTQVEKGALYTALESEDLDVGLEVWLPNTDKPFYDKFKDDLAWHEDWFEGTELGLYVPSYMEDINTMSDLKGKADQFDGKIVGIDAGSSLVSLTQEALPLYDLKDSYELQTSSGPVMTQELGKAVEDEEPIVVTLWKPHWVFAEYDVKLLEDPEKVYGEKENINWVSRKTFEDDLPEVTKTLNNWMMDDESLGSLMNMVKEEGEEAGAKKWVEENQDKVDEWTAPLSE
ncbi:glycine betaine ABC transporter substrate-binding protein [Pontibacillus salicampi]|uniref:Glycine betaine ABC transporter substrate-binding protein n=1 Tax=Pontibacillus salicampi TaxID=1449801 RepID=A0ABV6LN27_9BACI